MKRLEKKVDERIKRTYMEGLPTPHIYELVIVVTVGLMFMPGADKPQVTKFEQGSMMLGPSDQKSALWRVNIAGTLLRLFDVMSDLTVRATDRTLSIIESTKYRKNENILINL